MEVRFTTDERHIDQHYMYTVSVGHGQLVRKRIQDESEKITRNAYPKRIRELFF